MMEFITMLFDTVWSLYSIKWPGFPFTIGQAVIGALCAFFALRILLMLTGFSFGAGSTGDSISIMGGNNPDLKYKKIPKERRNDER